MSVIGQIVSPSQFAFITGRNITDNTILNHELMFYLNNRKCKMGYMALKIDMAKAYDRVDWSFLKGILLLHEFSPHFVDLIFNCISIPSYSVLLNGSPHIHFKASRGIRQGDPLSPALFTIFFNVFSKLLTKAKAEGKIHGVKMSRTSPPISHLMYADNLTIYCRANIEEVFEVAKYLHQFSLWSGLRVNYSKSAIHFSRTVKPNLKMRILAILGMSKCPHNSKYLG